MRLLGYIVLACIAFAALRLAALVLMLGAIVALIALLWTRPAEAFGLLVFMAFCSVLNTHPLTVIVSVAVLLALGMVIKSGERG